MRNLTFIANIDYAYRVSIPGLTKEWLFNFVANTPDGVQLMRLIDEWAPGIEQLVYSILAGRDSIKAAHVLFWKSRFHPQQIGGERLERLITILSPTAIKYDEFYKFDYNSDYVVYCKTVFNVDDVQPFNSRLVGAQQ
jgi:hypothetical protein